VNPVFLDTVGLLAAWDTSDRWHAAAEPVFLRLVASGRRLLTTALVLYECGNAAARRPYRTAVDDVRIWLAGRNWLIEPTVHDFDMAWTNYRTAHAGFAGIVDQVSFVVMHRLGLTEAFTNGRHFQAAGFTRLF